MGKDEMDFEFTVKDLDQMVLDAARGEEQGQKKEVQPNAIQNLLAKARANKPTQGKQ